MSFWVMQIKGEHVERLNGILRHYKKGTLDVADTWAKLCALYVECNPTREPPLLEEHSHNIDYMITTWFPLYANFWYEGSKSECERWVWRMAYSTGNHYKVCYEY